MMRFRRVLCRMVSSIPSKSLRNGTLNSNASRILRSHAESQFDLHFLGSGGAQASRARGSPCTLLSLANENWLFDMGEGSSRQAVICKKSLMGTTKVFITHMHGDHIFGLPSLLMQMGTIFMIGKQPEVDVHPIHIYGPPGLHQYLCTAMRLTETSISREVVVHEMRLREEDVYRMGSSCMWKREWEEYNHDYPRHKLRDSKNIRLRTIESGSDGLWSLFDDKGLSVKAGLISHKIPSFGYVVKEGSISGRMIALKVDELGVSLEDRPKLKLGLDVVGKNGEVVKYSDVCGPSVAGRKVVILGDTDNPLLLTDVAQNCDVLVHECTFANSKLQNALRSGHSTPAMAIKVAHKFNARRVALNHIGSQYVPFNMDAANFDAGLVTDGDLEAQAKEGFGLRRDHIHIVRDFEAIRIPTGGFSLNDSKFVSSPDAGYFNHDKPQRVKRPHSRPPPKEYRPNQRLGSLNNPTGSASPRSDAPLKKLVSPATAKK